MSVVTSKQTQSLVCSQRAVCTVLFLMAELYRCPSAVDDVREGRSCTCRFCSAICLHGLYNLLSVVRKHMEKLTCFRMSKSVRSPHAWLKAAPPVLSFIARFRVGFAPTSVLAENGDGLPSFGVVFEGSYRGARQVDTRAG